MCETPATSLCDRLKNRYVNHRQNWRSLLRGETREQNTRDVEFIRYIVNTIIEQAKHSIVIAELPELIRSLHCEAEEIIRKHRMITLEEAIAQVQLAGAKKYPFLKNVKPLTTAEFVKEVVREVFNQIGDTITLDMIENIFQFATCSSEQLLQAMPAINVEEAAAMIIEDILRNQEKNGSGAPRGKSAFVAAPSRKSVNEAKFRASERDSFRSMRNSNRSSATQHQQNYSNNRLDSLDIATPAHTRPSRSAQSKIASDTQTYSLDCSPPQRRPFVLEAVRRIKTHEQYYPTDR